MSSPVSRLFFANNLILARLSRVSKGKKNTAQETFRGVDSPVLEPDLDRPFGHVDLLGDSLADSGGGSRVLVEFQLQSGELVLGSPLSLLVLLLLSQGALARRASRVGRRVASRGRVGVLSVQTSRTGRRRCGSIGRAGSSDARAHGQRLFHLGIHCELGSQRFHVKTERLELLDWIRGCRWLRTIAVGVVWIYRVSVTSER